MKLQEVNNTYLGYWNSDCPPYDASCPITNMSAPTGFNATINVMVGVCSAQRGPVYLLHLLAVFGLFSDLFCVIGVNERMAMFRVF